MTSRARSRDGRGPALVAHIDGGSRGNPGPAGYGVLIENAGGGKVAELYGYLGIATNNIAEYTALLALLEHARRLCPASLIVRSDSQLLIRQMEGRYRVRDAGLRILHAAARGLCAGRDRHGETPTADAVAAHEGGHQRARGRQGKQIARAATGSGVHCGDS